MQLLQDPAPVWPRRVIRKCGAREVRSTAPRLWVGIPSDECGEIDRRPGAPASAPEPSDAIINIGFAHADDCATRFSADPLDRLRAALNITGQRPEIDRQDARVVPIQRRRLAIWKRPDKGMPDGPLIVEDVTNNAIDAGISARSEVPERRVADTRRGPAGRMKSDEPNRSVAQAARLTKGWCQDAT